MALWCLIVNSTTVSMARQLVCPAVSMSQPTPIESSSAILSRPMLVSMQTTKRKWPPTTINSQCPVQQHPQHHSNLNPSLLFLSLYPMDSPITGHCYGFGAKPSYDGITDEQPSSVKQFASRVPCHNEDLRSMEKNLEDSLGVAKATHTDFFGFDLVSRTSNFHKVYANRFQKQDALKSTMISSSLVCSPQHVSI